MSSRSTLPARSRLMFSASSRLSAWSGMGGTGLMVRCERHFALPTNLPFSSVSSNAMTRWRPDSSLS